MIIIVAGVIHFIVIMYSVVMFSSINFIKV